MSIIGTDHSKYDWCGQDGITGGYYYIPIAYDVAYRNGSRYAFLKACDGTNDTPFYSEAIRDARAAGLLSAPYVWLHGRNWFDPRKQGEHWYNKLKDEPLIVIDFEGYSDSQPTYDDLYGAITAMQSAGYTGRIMIYTGHFYWLANGSTADYWKQFPVWLARYYTEPPQDTPPWPTWTIWQFSASGDPSRYGITNGKLAVDENRFDGTIEELAALFGQAVTPPPQEENKMYKATVKVNTLRVRSDKSSAAPILRYLKLDDVVYTPFDVEVNSVSGMVWIRISEHPVEYLAVKDATTVFSTVEAVPGGGEIKPVITFHLSAEGYPAQDVTWTPL